MKEGAVQKSKNESKLTGMGGERCQGCSVTKHVIESEVKGIQSMCKTSNTIWNRDSVCYKISRKIERLNTGYR